MRTSCALCVTALSTLLASVAHAKEPDLIPVPAPAASTTSTASDAPSKPARQVPLTTNAPIEVGIGNYHCTMNTREGMTDTEARIIARLTCEELDTHKAAAGAYEVTNERFDGQILFTISGPGGARHATLSRVMEARTAIPRLIEAMVAKKSVQSTENVDNVLPADVTERNTKKKNGTMGATLGILSMNPVGKDAGAGTGGASVGIGYETGRLGVFGDLRYAVGESTQRETHYFAASGGARFYLLDGDTSPFLGAGLALTVITLKRADSSGSTTYYDGYGSSSSTANTGMAAYAELGIEVLRTHMLTLAATARGDAPMFALRSVERQSASAPVAAGNSSYTTTSTTINRSSYQVPVSGQLSMFLHW